MNLNSVVDAYCKRWGLRIIKGKSDNDPAPLLPFLMMDCAYCEFTKEIVPLDMRHDLKRTRKAWLADYRAFNQRLFSCLNADQRDFIIDAMDEYTSAIQNEVMFMRVAVMELVKGLEFEYQGLIASLMLCNIFAQAAQITWGAVYRTAKGHEERCPELDRMRNYSHKLMNTVTLIPGHIDTNADKRMNSAVDAFFGTTTKWLKEYNK